MTTPKLDELLKCAHKICILGDYDTRTLERLWVLTQEVVDEIRRKNEGAKKIVTEKRKENPLYARPMKDGKVKQYYVKKGDR